MDSIQKIESIFVYIYRQFRHQELKIDMSKKATQIIAPQCIACGAELKPFVAEMPSRYNWGQPVAKLETKVRAVEMTADDLDPAWGSRGDNIVCNLVCGHKLLLRLVRAIPDAVKLLPDVWRPDLRSPEQSDKAKKKAEAAEKRAEAARERARQFRAREARRKEAERIQLEYNLRSQAAAHGWTLVTDKDTKKKHKSKESGE